MKKRILAVISVVGIIILQSFALPSSRYRFHPQIDEDEYDSLFTGWNADSLKNFVDSMFAISQDSIETEFIYLEIPDSLNQIIDSAWRAEFLRDSLEKARIAFQHWFDSLPKKEQKKWTRENVIIPAQIARADSILAVKDSLRARRDSIRESIPRILESPFIPDSLRYKRLLLMHQDKKFGDIVQDKYDTTYNYHYYDYPFQRQDVNATWLGVAGSPVQMYDVTKRTEEENAIFFTPYRSWTYTPSSLPMYNTKTPYTELGYSGHLLSGETKEEINCRILTTQNITPAFNLTLELNRYGGAGYMLNSNTRGQNVAISTNYLGKRYILHGGWILSKISRQECGGFQNDTEIRDTTLASKELKVNLTKASNEVKRNTFFLNHCLRIPFGKDSLTTAFIGHNFELSIYKKTYSDVINDAAGRALYNNAFYLNSGSSADTMKVTKVDNSLYLRLQPWKDDSIVSKIDAGIGDKVVSYYDFYQQETDTGFKVWNGKTVQNNIYAYAQVKGMFKKYFDWNADGRFYFAGYQAGDWKIDAAAKFSFYPFRRDRKSPISITARFHTDQSTPDHYEKRILANHYRWDENFARKTRMTVGGTVEIPRWNLSADVAYSLFGNTIFYDNKGLANQSQTPVSVLTLSLNNNFALWKFHFDNRALVQLSSNQTVIPVPVVALNLRWYVQFDIVKKVLQMQLGANGTFNTVWNMPAYNPNLGIFFNQTDFTYGNNPYIDLFINMQWKRACIFIKGENINQGAPKKKNKDYFSAAHYIHVQRTIKFGISWPFYIQPSHKYSHSPVDGEHGGSGHDHSSSGAGRGGFKTAL